jgi:hypothetical protein
MSNVFSEAGYNELVAHSGLCDCGKGCSQYERCMNCGACLAGRQAEFCDSECANEYYATHDVDDFS